MAATNFNQSGGELRIQDGGAHESRPCWKASHQPQRRTGIGLTDFHGDTNHARVFAKMSRNFKIHVTTLINRSLFWVGNCPLDSKAWDQSLRLVRYVNCESIYTHVNQMRKNCIFENPNSLQEGPVSNLQTRSVHY